MDYALYDNVHLGMANGILKKKGLKIKNERLAF